MMTRGGVRVALDIDGSTHSATPTPPSHSFSIREGFADVDVVAEHDAMGKSATPTTVYPSSCALCLVGFSFCIILVGAPPSAPLMLLPSIPPILNPVWEDALSKAVNQVILHAPRAGSLVAHGQDLGGDRWHHSSPPVMDGEGHTSGLLAALQLGAPSTPLVGGRSDSRVTGALAIGHVWHPAIRAARSIAIRAPGDASPVSPAGLR